MKKSLYVSLMLAATCSVKAFNITGYHPAEREVYDVMGKHPMWNQTFIHGSFEPPHRLMAAAPGAIEEVSWVKDYPAALIYDQGRKGSCTANAAAYILRGLSVAGSATPRTFLNNPMRLDSSRLYHYWNTRKFTGDVTGFNQISQDTGASMVAAVLALDRYGITPESGFVDTFSIQDPFLTGKASYSGWKYSDDDITFTRQPDPEAYRLAFDQDLDGLNDGMRYSAGNARNPYSIVSKSLQYQDLASKFLKRNSALANTAAEKAEIVALFRESFSKGRPVYSGIMLDNTFMNDQRGYIPMPNLANFRPDGGHAIPFVGHGAYNLQNPKKKYFKFVNSWSNTWGDRGYGYLEEDYVTSANQVGLEAFSLWLSDGQQAALKTMHQSHIAASDPVDDVPADRPEASLAEEAGEPANPAGDAPGDYSEEESVDSADHGPAVQFEEPANPVDHESANSSEDSAEEDN